MAEGQSTQSPEENMSTSPSVVSQYGEEESASGKFTRKFKEAPFVPIGIAGLLGALAVGAYGYKKRGGMSTSVYLMQLRVTAQGMVVGAITLGIGYQLITKMMEKRKKNQ